MATNNEDKKPIEVQVSNFPNTKPSIDSIAGTARNIHTLLNGQGFKSNIKSISSDAKKSRESVDKISNILSDIRSSVEELEDTSKQLLRSSIPVPSLSNVSQDQTSSTYNSSAVSSAIYNELKELRNDIKSALLSIKEDMPLLTDDKSFNKEMIEKINDLIQGSSYNDEEKKKLSQNIVDKLNDLDRKESKRELDKISVLTSNKTSTQNALDQIQEILNNIEEETESAKTSEENAQKFADGVAIEELSLFKSLNSIGNDIKNLFVDNFKKVFEQWDRQIAALKENGMGGPNAAQLNLLTRRTMDATEETLGWNISIEKAIKATNSMIAAGQNPRYIRENNRQLIMGLEGIGIALSPATIKGIGNSVYESSQVKELVGGFAELTSPDTENAYSKSDLSLYLNSEDYKKLLSAAAYSGVSVADFQQDLIDTLKSAQRINASFEDAQKLAALQLSARYNLTGYNVPENTQSYIAMAQMAGTFKGMDNIIESVGEAAREAHSNTELMRRMVQTNLTLMASGDDSFFKNILLNEGRTRRQATREEIAEGQYEGFVVRAMKSLAGIFPAERMGALSQQLTGDSSFLTKAGFALAGGLFDTLKDVFTQGPQILLLGTIAKNTSFLGGGAGAGGLVDLMGSSGPLAGSITKVIPYVASIGLAVTAIAGTAATIYTFMEDSKRQEDMAKEAQQRAFESYEKEMRLEEERREALSQGNMKRVEEINKQLSEQRAITNQELKSKVDFHEQSTDDSTVAVGTGVGAGLGGLLAGLGIALSATGVGIPAGIALVAAGLGGGALLGGGATYLATSSSGPNYETETQKARRDLSKQYAYQRAKAAGYASGGLVSEEQMALVAEDNNPELIIPVTKPERAKELLTEYNIVNKDPVTQTFVEDRILPILNSLNGYLIDQRMNPSSIKRYENGGVVSSEQVALIGENNKPEAVIPLTDAGKASDIMASVADMQGVDKNVSEMMAKATDRRNEKTVAELIVDYAKSVVGVPYRDGGDSFDHPERGLLCNMLVEYAYHSAGADIKKGTVNAHRNKLNQWVFTDTPQAGFAIFSNYGDRDKYNSKDYQHMGIVGFGNERIHASKRGSVVIDPDYVKTLSYEFKESNLKKGNKPYTFAYLKGLDYGSGVDLPSPSSSSKSVGVFAVNIPNESVSLSSPADLESPIIEDNAIKESSVVSPYDVSMLAYRNSLRNLKVQTNTFNSDLLEDVLSVKRNDISTGFLNNLAVNNPFGLVDSLGNLKEYDTIDAGVQDFISKIEKSYDALASLSYKKQLDTIRDDHYISGSDYDKIIYFNQEKLANSIDNLNKSVQESNRIANRTHNTPVPISSPISGRRYV